MIPRDFIDRIGCNGFGMADFAIVAYGYDGWIGIAEYWNAGKDLLPIIPIFHHSTIPRWHLRQCVVGRSICFLQTPFLDFGQVWNVMSVKEITAKSILQKRKRIDSWFISAYGMNLYRGCTHNCVYCDGRSEKYRVDGEFGRDIAVWPFDSIAIRECRRCTASRIQKWKKK